MSLPLILILVPFAAGAALLALRCDLLRKLLVTGVVLAVAAGAVALAGLPLPIQPAVALNQHTVALIMMVLEAAMGLYVIYAGIRARRPLIVGLMLAQAGLITWFELANQGRLEVAHDLFLDKFSVIMALINGIVGGGICLYALGYMRDYHEKHHTDVADRRPLFFALLLIFMGAMFGIVFANNLLWFYFFWEITTLCSFLLIGYTRTEEARQNSLKALTMNLMGGLAFALAIVWFHKQTGSLDLQTLVSSKAALVLMPVALLCFAGMTKSAQFPFAGWLLGAMVAPTPVSALLHSSTMVKAGVYLVLRLAPVLVGTKLGLAVALAGAVTFVIGSFAAISSRDAKRLLAYSTIANLGLIMLCGGIGTSEALWAGMLLVVFHAVAKCLLFLCVGVVEHRLHSRDIEAMSGLILRMPRVAILMQIGMAGMFLAPFGMLISKWAVLKAVVDACPPLTVFIAFGSAATLFFWVKWMGKLIEVVKPAAPAGSEFGLGESVALYGLAALTFGTCLLFPCISSFFIEPHVTSLYGNCAGLSRGNTLIMIVMMLMVVLFPLSFLHYGRGVKVMTPYLGGANTHGSVSFRGSVGAVQEVTMSNYYLHEFCSETRLFKWGMICGVGLMLAFILLAML